MKKNEIIVSYQPICLNHIEFFLNLARNGEKTQGPSLWNSNDVNVRSSTSVKCLEENISMLVCVICEILFFALFLSITSSIKTVASKLHVSLEVGAKSSLNISLSFHVE